MAFLGLPGFAADGGKPTTTRLILLPDGAWINPANVATVVAEEYGNSVEIYFSNGNARCIQVPHYDPNTSKSRSSDEMVAAAKVMLAQIVGLVNGK